MGDVKLDNAHDNASNSDTYLHTLANRNDPICVTSSKVAKASIIGVAVASIIMGIMVHTFANVNTALRRFIYIGEVCGNIQDSDSSFYLGGTTLHK
jgi:hypothetical protein